MGEKSVSFQYEARYFTMGELNKETKNVWMICHGYGQIVPYFKKKFQPLADAGNFLIFPEGLHNFYHEIKGKRVPVASWMTSENREMAIRNYLTYMSKIFELECPEVADRAKLKALGFSQGSHTIIRWLVLTNQASLQTFICGGSLPSDLDFIGHKANLSQLNLTYFYGDQDKFADETHIAKERETLDTNQITYKMNSFEGGHSVPVQLILKESMMTT